MIQIKKLNESTVVIDSDDHGILMELNEHFTFYVDGYKFMPAYKNKMWDGKIRLYSLRTQTIPYGLVLKVYEFAQTRGYKVQIDPDVIPDLPAVEQIREYIDSLYITSDKGERIKPRDYQMDAIIHSIQNKRALILSPTGSGKSLIIYCITRYFLEFDADFEEKAAIVVPTTSLVEQMTKDFGDYSQKDKTFDASCMIHKIYSGQDKDGFSAPVVITTWQSLIRLPKGWFTQFGFIVGDEAHLFKAKSLNQIMGNMVNARYRIGTTGTLDDLQCNELVLIGNFGPVFSTITTKELIDAKTLSDLKIQCIILKHDSGLSKVVSKMKYQDEIAVIVAHEARNHFIADLAVSLKGNTLVLFNYVENHGEPLFRLIQSKIPKDRNTHFVSGKVQADAREKIREMTEREDGTIIVASLGVFSTGINIKNLHNIIFAAPTKSQIKVLQSIGRGLRKAENGQACTVFDITDDFSHGKKRNYTLNHGRSRAEIYVKQGFEFSTHGINMPISYQEEKEAV